MKIDIAAALQHEGQVFGSEYSGPFRSVSFAGEQYEFPAGANVSADYFFDGEGISVTGRFEAQTQAVCSRCLKPVKYTAQFGFSERYLETPEEGDYAFSGEMIDLSLMLEDNLVLNLPSRHLCRQTCAGLCPKCGKDLNEGPCGCEDIIDESNPFYQLSKLNQDEEV